MVTRNGGQNRELITHICGVAGRKVSDMQDFIEDWLKVTKLYQFSIISQAWEKIRVMQRSLYPDPYFDLSVWEKTASTIYYEQREQEKKSQEPKKSYVGRDAEMKAWRDNFINWTDRKITRGEYLKVAAESGQMNALDLTKAFAYAEKHKLPMLGHHHNNKLNIMKGVF